MFFKQIFFNLFQSSVALTDGLFVNLDVNGKPFNLNKGIVTQNIKSEWKILCDDNGSFNDIEVANDICQVIGFRFDLLQFIL